MAIYAGHLAVMGLSINDIGSHTAMNLECFAKHYLKLRMRGISKQLSYTGDSVYHNDTL